MDDGDGAYTLELQAYKVVKNALVRGKAPCPQCGLIMNPVQYMYSVNGLCQPCTETRKAKRIKGKMA
jgi:ribosomal protein S27AE